jgi:phage terminase large subunit-like protein
MILQKRIAHDGDPLLAKHIGNVIKYETDRGWRMSKPKGSPKHIDAAMAAAFAVAEISRTLTPNRAPKPRLGVGF